MKKKSVKKKVVAEAKSAFRIAGEAIGTIGHEIVEGKDKLVELSEAAVDKFKSVKKAISKKIAPKKVKPAAKKKVAAVKKKAATVKKSAKKVVKKVAKKIKKAAPKKVTKKK